ncbi:uncharacterized protein LOC142785279 [Rhipicephalus microplus]|uniref:uncharacterized protein LOC142785279 n=1 Tax=Rhipicephalus microplus TaxID=6941 RepID=UPI003F6BA95F
MYQPRFIEPAGCNNNATSYPAMLHYDQPRPTAMKTMEAPSGTTKEEKSRRDKRRGLNAALRRGSKSPRTSRRRVSPSRSPTRGAASKLEKGPNHGGTSQKMSISQSAKSPRALARKADETGSPKSRKRRTTGASSPARHILPELPPVVTPLNVASPPWLLPSEMTAPLIGPPLLPQQEQQSHLPSTMYVPCHDQNCEAFPKISEVPWGLDSVPPPQVPDHQYTHFSPTPGQPLPPPILTHGSTLPQMQYTTGLLQPAPTLSYDPMGGYQVNRERLEPGYSPFPSQGQSAYPNDRMPPGILRHYVSRANDGSRRWQEKARAKTHTKTSSSSSTTSSSEVSNDAGGSKKVRDNAWLALGLGCAGFLAFVGLYALLNVAVNGRRSAHDGVNPMTVQAEYDGPLAARHRFEAPKSQVMNAPSAGDTVNSGSSGVLTEKDASRKERSSG